MIAALGIVIGIMLIIAGVTGKYREAFNAVVK